MAAEEIGNWRTGLREDRDRIVDAGDERDFDVLVLELEAVTPENYAETLELSVADDQRHLISSVTESLADAFVWDARVRVARESSGLVGFVMAHPFEIEDEPVVNIVRLMVDRHHQGRGVGRAMLSKSLEWISGFHPSPRRVRISTHPENHRALRLYRSAGFEGAEIENGEVVLWRQLIEPGHHR